MPLQVITILISETRALTETRITAVAPINATDAQQVEAYSQWIDSFVIPLHCRFRKLTFTHSCFFEWNFWGDSIPGTFATTKSRA